MKLLLNGFAMLCLLAAVVVPVAGQEPSQDQPAAEAAETPETGAAAEATAEDQDPRVAVIQADRDFAKAVADRDVEEFAALVAEDAVFLSGDSMLHGRAAVVEAWKPLMAEDRATELTWAPKGVRMAQSQDLAYTIGDYELTARQPEGDPVTIEGQYLSVWGLGEDGAWRAVADGPLRRDRAAFLEVTLEKQGRLGPGVGAVFAFRPEKTVKSAAEDLSYTLGVYEARRVNADGSEESLAEGGWLAVWALDPSKPESGMLPGGDAVTPPAMPVLEEAVPEAAPEE